MKKIEKEDLLSFESAVFIPNIILNKDMVLFVNKAFRDILGWSLEDVTGRNPDDILLTDKEPEHIRGLKEILEQLELEEEADQLEENFEGRLLILAADGSATPFYYRGQAVQFYDKKYLALWLVEISQMANQIDHMARCTNTLTDLTLKIMDNPQWGEEQIFGLALEHIVNLLKAPYTSVLKLCADGLYRPYIYQNMDHIAMSRLKMHKDEVFLYRHSNTEFITGKASELGEHYLITGKGGTSSQIQSIMTYSPAPGFVFSADHPEPHSFTAEDLHIFKAICAIAMQGVCARQNQKRGNR